MKHLFTLLTTGLLGLTALAADVKEVPYSTPLGGDSDWTVVDVNQDGKTWSTDNTSSNFSGSGCSTGIKYSYSSYNPGDDWYISPAVHLEAGKEYKLKIWHKNTSTTYEEAFKIFMAKGSSVDDLSAGTELFSYLGKGVTKQDVVIFSVDETGDYFFGIYECSPKDRMTLYLSNFQIAENIFAPAGVSNLKVTEGDDHALEASLTWELPTVDSDGAAMPDDASFDEVLIFRDGIQIASLAGTATSFTDSQQYGLTSGKHTYEVQVVVNGSKSSKTAVSSKYVGPVEAQTLPYDAAFASMTQEDFELLWNSAIGRDNANTNQWQLYNAYYGNYLRFQPSYQAKLDTWLISPEMKFTKPGIYRLTFTMQYSNMADINFDIILGKGTAIGGYTEPVIANLTKLPTYYEDFEYVFEVTEAGEYGIAFHITSESAMSNFIQVNQFKVEEWKEKPVHVTDLSTAVNTDATVSLAWTNPAVNNIGKSLDRLDKVELYANDNLVETFSDVTPGAPMTYTHTPATSGVHTYHVLAYLDDEAADGDPIKVKTAWVGDETQPLPYATSFAEYDATAPIWSGYDANNDGITWTIGSSAIMKNTTSTTKFDDYLLSPYFNLKAGYYTVKAYIKGSRYQSFAIGTVTDKDNVTGTYSKLDEKALTAASATLTFILHIEQAGRQAIAIHNNDGIYGNTNEVTSFSIEYTPVLPGVATDLSVVPAADLSLSATITWKNPEDTNIEGVTATDLTEAIIKRDGQTIATVTEGLVPGETSTYVDNEVPNAGEYTYSVEIHNAEGCSSKAAASVKSPWIGAGMDLPFSCEDSFSDAGWNIYNVNNDKASWGGQITWEAGGSSIHITSYNTTPDDWAITPRLNFVAGKVYKIEVESYYSNGYEPVDWDLHFGTSVNPSDMSIKIATVHTDQPSATRRTDTFFIDATSPDDISLLADETDESQSYDDLVTRVPAGVGTIGLHANNKGAFNVSGFKVSYNAPTGIENVSAGNSEAFVLDGKVAFAGMASEVLVADMTGKIVLTAANVDTIDLSHLSHGVYVVRAVTGNNTVTLKVTI